MMTGEERRSDILNTIRNAQKPISGTVLSKKYQVSRQVIVQDIALLRAANYDIYSTPRGYGLTKAEDNETTVISSNPRCIIRVTHTDSQIVDELNTIVDLGGKVLDVFINHKVYGSIRADLPVSCRRHVQEFIDRIHNGQSSPLKNLTSGEHYHTIEADSEKTLRLIEETLRQKGYLLEVIEKGE